MSEPRAKRPWWSYAVPYFGAVPDLGRRQWRTLGLLAMAELFDQYDVGLMGLALKQIQEGLAIPEDEIAGVGAVVRLGVLPALAVTVLADRIGRRRLLLATIVGFTAATFGTAFVASAGQFMLLQLIARCFIYAETMLAVVVLAEELSARDRGFGIGMLGALGALGHGLSAIAFGFVDVLPFGWRALYALGGIPMLLLAWLRRSLPETARFEAHRAREAAAGHAEGGWLRPVVLLVRMYPRRIAALGLALFPFEFVILTAVTFMPKTLQELHGYSPADVTVLYLAGGALGILGNIYAGTLSDRLGRRWVIAPMMLLGAGAIWGFFNLSGWVVAAMWIAQVFTMTGVSVLFKALGSELFPTSYRSTASAVRAIVGTLGGVLGLALEGTLYNATGSHAAAITAMLPVMLVTPLVVLWALPETASRELEEIAPER